MSVPILKMSNLSCFISFHFVPNHLLPVLFITPYNARLFFIIMFIIQPLPSLPTSVDFNVSSTPDIIDNIHISTTGMFALKLYAFGGLTFMIGVILFALGGWVWTVIIKREWANSPPELELHPEVSKLACFLFFLF